MTSMSDSRASIRKPWRGRFYRDRLLGRRLLIVGESHHAKHADHEDLTRDIIHDVVAGKRIPFYTKVARLFAMEPAEFYQYVSFYNYLQEVMPGPKQPVGHSQRLKKEDQKLFVKVLRRLQPERVLVLGKTNWRFLPSAHPASRQHINLCAESDLRLMLPGELHPSERCAYWYQTGRDSWALVGAIIHPSAPGFRSKECDRWIRRFMEFKGLPPTKTEDS